MFSRKRTYTYCIYIYIFTYLFVYLFINYTHTPVATTIWFISHDYCDASSWLKAKGDEIREKKPRIWRTNNCKFTCASKKITRCHLQDEFNSSDPSTIQHRGHLLLVSSLLCTLEAAAQGLHLTLQGVNLQRSGASPMMPCCLGFDMFVPKFRKKDVTKT